MSDGRRSAVFLAAASAAAAAAGVVLAGSSAVADPRREQERITEQVAEAQATLEHATDRARQAAAEFAAAEAALPAAEARLGETRGELVAAQVLAETAERESQLAEDDLAAAGERVADSARAVDHARQGVAALAVAAYKGGRIAGVRLMLRADGPAEAIERLGYLGHISGVERAALDDLSGARLRARQRENEAVVAYERAERASRQAGAALGRAAEAEVAAATAAAAAKDLAEARAEALQVAESEREESLRRYEEAEAASERIAAQVREWEAQQAALARQQAAAAAPAPVDSGSGHDSDRAASGGADSGTRLAMPARGWLSSAFGMRHDPFFGVWQLHAGMDIAAPGGAPVHAAANGTVIWAGWSGGYGNLTCLSHGTHQGQGLSTCYAHQSEILVVEGESVAQGDLIGRVGTTGASTGNHLHFEVRLDGSPSDPVQFLPDCLC